jgi:hypothetical protein
MSDAASRAAEALEELRDELAHADALIAEQQDQIQTLERRVQLLRAKPYARREGAA